ncbi:putative ornithine decarboxylase [Companilactobacillus mishanensis]|uniref:Putative ornithine decarboxylase n=1 Tax=Companilactobacillus mishanensis TaxID=2486008 RepID=A0A5P0ZG67_9LACO|nr:putative ornithine decarboxylase [Companilactobacillus mishanensis]MQS51999.1 putative ornithine decarboxylase [Companilactobacillus mishanensis]
MNFLKIAHTKDVNRFLPTEWESIDLAKNIEASELAAIVYSRQDADAKATSDSLLDESGLNVPVVEVDLDQDEAEVRTQIERQIEIYENDAVPKFLTDLINFAEDKPISFTTPGHHNGQYYEKHPAGVVFNRFFGKNLMYADVSDTVAELGDTMTHEGTPLDAEQKAAETYHADKVYFCTNGTTSSNSICASAALTEGDLVLFDRNNHKSLYNSALVMSGAKPVYIPTDRNPLGLIGEMDPGFLDEDKLRAEIAKVDPEKAKAKRPFRLAVLQLETYDGVFYNAKWIINKIGKLCDYILFDCAWGGFEQFLPIMEHLSPLSYDYGPDDPGILVTQSLHKQQAGLAQTSQILKKDSHLKGQDRYIDHKHFNNAYLKFVTSSYSYPIYASLTVNAFLTSGKGNKMWWDKTLRQGIEWRKKLLQRSKLFKPLVPDGFENMSTEELATNPDLWYLKPTDKWHGFKKVADGQVMLDPLKLTVITPGIDIENDEYEDRGIPGPVVAEYLTEQRIIRAKDDLNSLLFLLVPGDTEEELDTLLNAFLKFEEYYSNDAPLSKVMPRLTASNPDRYAGYTLKQLCQEMHEYYSSNRTFRLQQKLFSKPDMQDYEFSPEHADKLFMKNKSTLVNLDEIVGRTALEGALPYPPGVFIVAPGEKWQKLDQSYFEVLVGAIEQFPGFVPEIQGVYWNKDKEGKIRVQAEVLPE